MRKSALLMALILLSMFVCSCGTSKNFNDLYPGLNDEPWCKIASDGSYMKIDSNPYDKDGDRLTGEDLEKYVRPANEMIKQVNKDLGFSDALTEKMNSTTWSHGQQTESNDKYKVAWTYHPNKGLEVMYELR